MASNSAFLHPQSNPCLIATAPMNNPIPNIDFSTPIVSFFSLIESKCRIFPPNQTLITPSALPNSLRVFKLLASILKKGPNVWIRISRFCNFDAFTISDIVGTESSRLFVLSCVVMFTFWIDLISDIGDTEISRLFAFSRGYSGSSLIFWADVNWVFGFREELRLWIRGRGRIGLQITLGSSMDAESLRTCKPLQFNSRMNQSRRFLQDIKQSIIKSTLT